MKTLLAAAVVASLVAMPLAAAPFAAPPALQRVQSSSLPPWKMDDGSSSDYPIHNRGDISGDELNRAYSRGLYVSPGHGFPAR